MLTIHGQSCLVGTDTTEFEANRAHGFYLNTQDPAQCDGTITEFQYCYYRSNLGLQSSYDFTFAVFRETSSGTYTSVSNAFTTGRTVINANLPSGTDFACASYSPSTVVDIQAGDVIGACIYDPPDVSGINGCRVQLDVVGRNAGSDQYIMSTGNSGCGNSAVPNTVTFLTRMDSSVVHIHADISK